MISEPSFDHAKFSQTLIVDPVGFCYVVTHVSKPVGGDLNQALWQYQNKYWAEHLLRNHADFWGYSFDLLSLYHQLRSNPLQCHKSRDEMINELSDLMTNGELLVYCVNQLISPPHTAQW